MVPVVSFLLGLAAGGAVVACVLYRNSTWGADTFKALASDALRSNNDAFLQLAGESLSRREDAAKRESEDRHRAIEHLLEPVREALRGVDAKVEELERARVGAYAGLSVQVSSLRESQAALRAETSKLAGALRRPAVRGRWGELQLRRVVELAGMTERCDFDEQPAVSGAADPVAENGGKERRLRPDLVVRLPGSRSLVVDAKAPLDAYLAALEAPDADARGRAMRAHARHVRRHIRSLASKAYCERIDPAPEFVVLFLPGEAFFSAALEHDRELIEFGAARNVIVASPTTLIALLRGVACGWRQEQLTQSAAEIRELGRSLYGRLASFAQHLAAVGHGLESATSSYNRAVGSLESRVLVAARRFEKLGAGSARSKLDAHAPLEERPRELRPRVLSKCARREEESDARPRRAMDVKRSHGVD